MKKLTDFKDQNLENLENFQGGGKGEFVHSYYKLFNLVSHDVFYDENGNGKLDEDNKNEVASFNLSVLSLDGD